MVHKKSHKVKLLDASRTSTMLLLAVIVILFCLMLRSAPGAKAQASTEGDEPTPACVYYEDGTYVCFSGINNSTPTPHCIYYEDGTYICYRGTTPIATGVVPTVTSTPTPVASAPIATPVNTVTILPWKSPTPAATPVPITTPVNYVWLSIIHN